MRYSALAFACAVGVVIACSDASTTTGALAPMGPRLASGGNSGCYTVQFNSKSVPTAPLTFAGPVTGDLVGSATFTIDPSTLKTLSHTVSFDVDAVWVITGGIIPNLTGFQTRGQGIRAINVDRPGSSADVAENVGTHRAVSGVQKANLSFRGTFSNIDGTADHDYHGVICP